MRIILKGKKIVLYSTVAKEFTILFQKRKLSVEAFQV